MGVVRSIMKDMDGDRKVNFSILLLSMFAQYIDEIMQELKGSVPSEVTNELNTAVDKLRRVTTELLMMKKVQGE